ncbi:MAG: serine/threonine protein kinase [Planctomycetes bacterium]|nr:serine/threonine protein kinase [Planctomycetota bacterium]
MADLVGKTLGDFAVEALIGKGSMARVYRACQVSLRRTVALKVLEEEIFTPGEKVRRFLREAEALARLEHPHIVPIYAAGEEPPYYYFAMRLVPGGTLADAMVRGIERASGLAWARQVCQALAHAHSLGVVHRDLKPSNVLIQDDVALLGDFGLARLRDLSTITQAGIVLGTPLYMSPEHTLGEPATAASDCFALGVLLYQMLTGRHPFVDQGDPAARNPSLLFERVRKGEIEPPSAHDPQIGAGLERAILRALARRPEDRYRDAGAMLDDLEAAVESDPAARRVVLPSPEAREALARSETEEVPRPEVAGEPAGDEARPRAEPPGARAPALPVPASSTAGSTAASAAGSTAAKASFLFGRYEVLGEIGHGGQGVVYRARDPLLDRLVALKVLQGGWKADPRVVELFRNEARIAARLDHPHIIQVLDFGLEEESPYLTMTLVEGPSLDRLIGRGRPLPVPFALEVLAQTAEALAFAHEEGVVHLDVKPGNVLLRESRRRRGRPPESSVEGLRAPHAYLTDFTMARIASEATPGGVSSGTVPYAAPEQLDDSVGSAGPSSDVFSLGVVLHEMLTGRRLFEGDDASVARLRVLHAPVPPPSSAAPGIPAGADALCARMLERRPERRPASAAEVLAAAEEMLRTVGA